MDIVCEDRCGGSGRLFRCAVFTGTVVIMDVLIAGEKAVVVWRRLCRGVLRRTVPCRASHLDQRSQNHTITSCSSHDIQIENQPLADREISNDGRTGQNEQ